MSRLLALGLVVVAASVAVAVAGDARAGFTPAWSYVPAPLRTKLAVAYGGTLYLPARTPLFYRYRSGAAVVGGKLYVPFTNRVRVRQGVWRWTKDTFVWRVEPLAAGTGCTAWQTPDKTLQLSGNKVYWAAGADGGTAWRCITDRTGRTHVLSVSSGAKVGDVGFALAVASGLDVSHRTSGVNVALSASPTTVRRGSTVLVRGVAGGCTSGDTLTIMSRAFPATHSFAGVPAIYGQVGSAGRFSAVTRIPLVRAPGAYVITARCGGGNLGVSAHLTVTR